MPSSMSSAHSTGFQQLETFGRQLFGGISITLTVTGLVRLDDVGNVMNLFVAKCCIA